MLIDLQQEREVMRGFPGEKAGSRGGGGMSGCQYLTGGACVGPMGVSNKCQLAIRLLRGQDPMLVEA